MKCVELWRHVGQGRQAVSMQIFVLKKKSKMALTRIGQAGEQIATCFGRNPMICIWTPTFYVSLNFGQDVAKQGERHNNNNVKWLNSAFYEERKLRR